MIRVTLSVLTTRRTEKYTSGQFTAYIRRMNSQSFFRFCAKECFLFFQCLIDPPITRSCWPQDLTRVSPTRDLIFLRYNLDRFPLISMPRAEKSTICTCASLVRENKGYANILHVVVLTAKSVACIQRGTTLGTDRTVHLGGQHFRTSNYWAARLVPGTAFWNEHEFTVSVSFQHGPS